jgi:alanyl-tRNA synthetase
LFLEIEDEKRNRMIMGADPMKGFWKDPYLFAFEGEIKGVVVQEDRIGVIFDKTFFYPEGGGQPSDHGKIGKYQVMDVQEIDDSIVHYVQKTPESEKELVKGTRIPCEIDKDYRINNMRLHTACHLLFGAARRIFSEVNYAGFNIGEIGNLYLETPNPIRANDLREMSLMANQVVVDDHVVKDYFVDKNGISSMKDFAFNIKLPDGDVRVIEIEGWDLAACSGTHVRRTVEIGPIKILAREIHKKNVTRIDYAVGTRAVKEIYQDENILAESSEFLSTSKDSLVQIIQKNSASLQANQKDIKKLSERLVDYQVLELEGKGNIVNGIRLIISVVDILDGSACRAMAAKILAESKSTVTAIIGGGNEAFIVAGSSNDLNLEISPAIINIARGFGGNGGGRPNFVTIGSMKANTQTVRDAVEKELTAMVNRNK